MLKDLRGIEIKGFTRNNNKHHNKKLDFKKEKNTRRNSEKGEKFNSYKEGHNKKKRNKNYEESNIKTKGSLLNCNTRRRKYKGEC